MPTKGRDVTPNPVPREYGREDLSSGESPDGGAELRRLLPGRRLQLIPHTVDPKHVFRFEFGPAILAQVREQLEILPILPILSPEVSRAAYPGFYQLLRAEQSQYVGRTTRPIRQRLREHIKRLRGRIPLEEIGCRFLFVEDLSLAGLSEDSLIAYFHPREMDLWGKQGFGSKVPGYGRAGQASAWDEAHPPDLDWPVDAGGEERLIREQIQAIARQAPITLSVPRRFARKFNTEFKGRFTLPEGTQTFGEWVNQLERILHPNWVIDRQPMGWYIVPANARVELEGEPTA